MWKLGLSTIQQGLTKIFLKGPEVDGLEFVDLVVSVATFSLQHKVINRMSMNECDCVQIRLYSQKRIGHSLWAKFDTACCVS